MICCFGICIPISMLWPILLLAIKPVYNYLAKVFNWTPIGETTKSTDGLCTGDTCCIPSNNNNNDDNKEEDNNNNNEEELSNNYIIFNDSHSLDEICHKSTHNYLKFTATWCRPCKEIEPVFHDLSAKYKKSSFISIDVDEFEDVAAKYTVMALPLFVVVDKHTKQIDKLMGKDKEKLIKLIEKYEHCNN